MADIPVEDVMSNIWDPLIRSTGQFAMFTATIVTICSKLQNALKSSPTETAIKNILPQAYHRALLSCRDGHGIIKAQLERITQISTIKERLKSEGKTLKREEKLALWTEIMIQSYAVLIVAPPILASMVVALTLRSAVGLLVHLHRSVGDLDKYIIDDDNKVTVNTNGDKKANSVSAAMSLSSLLGTSAFSQDDMDEQRLQTSDYGVRDDFFPPTVKGTHPSIDHSRTIPAAPSHNALTSMTRTSVIRSSSQTNKIDYLSPTDIINILCDLLPELMDRARTFVMQAIGIHASNTTINFDENRLSGTLTTISSLASTYCTISGDTPHCHHEDIHTLSASVKLSSLEGALRGAQENFNEYMLDWQGEIFGSSPRLFIPKESPPSSEESLESHYSSVCNGVSHGVNKAVISSVEGHSSTTNQLSESSTRSSTIYTNECASQELCKNGLTDITTSRLTNIIQTDNKSDALPSAVPAEVLGGGDSTHNNMISAMMNSVGGNWMVPEPDQDTPDAVQYRRRTRAYMQDLLTSTEVHNMCKALGAETSHHWLDVVFFHCPSPAAVYTPQSVTITTPQRPAAPNNSNTNNIHSDSSSTVFSPNLSLPVGGCNARCKESCKSYNPETGTVTLLQFVVYVDMVRQELMADPLIALEDLGCRRSTRNMLMALVGGQKCDHIINGNEDITSANTGIFNFSTISAAATHTSSVSSRFDGVVIPACVKQFCEEMIRLSGPK
eukprot:Tbor_TRINITY_DN3197_c0_g1::TRINITY_DN3197_c0_g1_i1::g.14691::m.14691